MPSADPARSQPSRPAASGSGPPSGSMRLPAPGALRPQQQPGSPIVLRTGPQPLGAAPAGSLLRPLGMPPAPAAQQSGALPAAPRPSYGPAPSAPRPTASGFGATAPAAFGAQLPAAVPGQQRPGGISPATGPPRSPAAAPTAYTGGAARPLVLGASGPVQLHFLQIAGRSLGVLQAGHVLMRCYATVAEVMQHPEYVSRTPWLR